MSTDEKPTTPAPPPPTPPAPPSTLKTWRRRAMLLGVVLAVVCKFLPEDYRGPCATVVSLCTGMF